MKWLTTISVKSTFVDTPTDDDIKVSAKLIVSGLENIQKAFEKVINDNFLDLDMVLDNFRFIVNGIENNIDFHEHDSLNSWNSWTDVFNEYMNFLYDLGNEIVNVAEQKGYEDGDYKFIFIR